jgi:hypothetical protein
MVEHESNKPASVPAEFRGNWRMNLDVGGALPGDYADLEIFLAERPEDCAIYRSKGISRLEMFKDAKVTETADAGQGLKFLFTAGKRSFQLELNYSGGKGLGGHVLHVAGDKTLLDASIKLVEQRPPTK